VTDTILCVDPDEADREETVGELGAALADLDPAFETAGSLEEAEASLDTDTRAIITEYELPDGTGFDLVGTARETCPDAGCVLYTDTDLGTIDVSALRAATAEYVGKGSAFAAERLGQLVRTIVESKPQTTYPTPQSEPERLAALRSYDLAGHELVSSLDRVTNLAAEHFGVRSASVNIISEHSQDFLSCYGAAENWGDSVNREDSICTFTILEDGGVMTVEDTTEDPRFESRSESLLEMGIRSYMGANLVTDAGLVIGTLCVYDEEPRSFSPAEEAYLRDLASVAMDLVELHSRLERDRITEADG